MSDRAVRAASRAGRRAEAAPASTGASEETISFPLSRLRSESLGALALLLLYLATMSGHLSSMDGIYMERQAQALLFDHSVKFRTPLWTWRREPTWNSIYGIGLSLTYLPGMLIAAPLRAQVPVSIEPPRDRNGFYLRELYENPLYTVGASWTHAVVVALTAWLAARSALLLGCSQRAALWGMAFFGIGSPAFVYARGDFAQPLEALCWTAAIWSAIAWTRSEATQKLAICSASILFAILARPIEGILLAPAAAALMFAAAPREQPLVRRLLPVGMLAIAAIAGVAGTLFVNFERFGNPLEFGYPEGNFWVVPGLARWAAVTISPGRGILLEFPAIVLAPLGVVALARRARAAQAGILALLCFLLLLNVASWAAWWGGWCWGLRLFAPAVPLVSVLAAAGTERLSGITRRLVPAFVLLAGFAWALPGVVTDLLGGYASGMDSEAFTWQLSSYPPYGAWRFLRRLFPASLVDANTVDILWFRLAPSTGYGSLVVGALLLVMAVALVVLARGRIGKDEAGDDMLPQPVSIGTSA